MRNSGLVVNATELWSTQSELIGAQFWHFELGWRCPKTINMYIIVQTEGNLKNSSYHNQDRKTPKRQ